MKLERQVLLFAVETFNWDHLSPHLDEFRHNLETSNNPAIPPSSIASSSLSHPHRPKTRETE